MNSRLEACQSCPYSPDQCRPENRAASIVEKFDSGEITLPQATAGVSTMQLEGRQLGCPPNELVRIRRAALYQINPQLEELDTRRSFTIGPAHSDPVAGYNRTKHRRESYDQYLFRRHVVEGNR